VRSLSEYIIGSVMVCMLASSAKIVNSSTG